MAGGTGSSKKGIGKSRRSSSRESTPSRFFRWSKIHFAGFSEKRPSRVLPTMTEMTVIYFCSLTLSAFRFQLIRSPGFHRPIMRVATSGGRRRPFKNAPVKLARPVCKTVPADLGKIPTQCGHIGVVADAVEPLEHERRILALLASRSDWDFLIVDRAADGLREDFRLLLTG